MEVEINKEILSYREAVWFGLSLKEICAVLVAVGFSALAYFTTGIPAVCIAVSAPPILAGFYQYHGMGGGRFLLTLLHDTLRPRRLVASRTDTAFALREIASAAGRRAGSARRKESGSPAKKQKERKTEV